MLPMSTFSFLSFSRNVIALRDSFGRFNDPKVDVGQVGVPCQQNANIDVHKFAKGVINRPSVGLASDDDFDGDL